jgi:hypothetical protein
MKFSQRIGIQPIKTIMQVDYMDDDLRNSLWTVIHTVFLTLGDSDYDQIPVKFSPVVKSLWINFFKLPIDTLSVYSGGRVVRESFSRYLRQWYFKAKWFEIYDLIESLANHNIPNFIDSCNNFLKKELSAYRFIKNQLVQITSEEEILEIENAQNSSEKYRTVKIHINAALSLMADRKSPDYRNSIKESISAVESLCIIITGEKKATLGQALKIIENRYTLHTSLKNSFSSLYGYTSDGDGIRHALIDESNDLGFEEAKLILVTCSSFVNYLISKYE